MIMGLRRQAREVALQGVFMCDFHSRWVAEHVRFCFDHFGVVKTVQPFAESLALGVIENISRIDSELTKSSAHWSISRMARVDRCILRVAAYEILFVQDTPASVAINEAIEIAKRFGSEDSPSFINGVLDKLASTHRLVVEKSAHDLAASSAKSDPREEITREEITVLEKVLLG
jgi:transcription antitermination protein NusB